MRKMEGFCEIHVFRGGAIFGQNFRNYFFVAVDVAFLDQIS